MFLSCSSHPVSHQVLLIVPLNTSQICPLVSSTGPHRHCPHCRGLSLRYGRRLLAGFLAPIHPRCCDDDRTVSSACGSRENDQVHSMVVKALQALAWLPAAAMLPASLIPYLRDRAPWCFGAYCLGFPLPGTPLPPFSAGLSQPPLRPSSSVSALGSLQRGTPSSVFVASVLLVPWL